MIEPNTSNSNNSKATFGGLASNTRLIPPFTTPTTTNKSSEPISSNGLQAIEPKDDFQAVLHSHSDWVTINFGGLPEGQFKSLLQRLGRELITLEKGKSFSQGDKAKTYSNTIDSPIGLKGAYTSYKTENGIDSHYDLTISLSGQYFSSLSTIEQWEVYRDLYYDYSASCSRVDTSIDDYSFKLIPLDEMIEAYRRGDYFDFRSYHHETDESDPNNPVTTHYFGAEGSKKLARIYNHQNESRRLETQFRGKYARVAFEAIATLKRQGETDNEWSKIIQKTIGGIAVGTVDFQDKSKLKNQKKAGKSKTKRFSWWQDFIDQVGAVHLIKVTKQKPDLTMCQNKLNWLEKMASKTLAKVFHLIGHERFISYVYGLVRLGESRFTPQDRKEIEYLKDNLDYFNFD